MTETNAGAYRLVVAAMLLATFSTGVVDAATYLSLDRVFIANMTGNVIFAGLRIAGAPGFSALRPMLAVGGFALGAAVAGYVGIGRPKRRALAFALTGLAFAAAGFDLATPRSNLSVDFITAALAAAMGLQAIAARAVGVADVSTVVVTSTLAALVSELPNRGEGNRSARRASAVIALVCGALVGALTVRVSIALSMSLAGGCLVCVASLVRGATTPESASVRELSRFDS